MYHSNNSSLDDEIKALISARVNEYCIVSFLGGFFDFNVSAHKNIILLLPYSEETCWDSKKIAWQRLGDDFLRDNLGSCISIFIVEPHLICAATIAEAINKVDIENQVDQIWLYPDPQPKIKRRSDIIETLPYQTKYATKNNTANN